MGLYLTRFKGKVRMTVVLSCHHDFQNSSQDRLTFHPVLYKLSFRYRTTAIAANHKTRNVGTFTRAELSIFLS